MRRTGYLHILLPLILILAQIPAQAKKQKSSLVTSIEDYKDFKKLLKAKTNVLVLYLNSVKKNHSIVEVFKETSDALKGQATLVLIDCNGEANKKRCKKFKVSSEKPYCIKHYKDGEYHKDYDRGETVSSLSNFLRDPTGDLPWEEDPLATGIYHLQDADALTKFIRKSSGAIKSALIMFYAPWCGYCKQIKPEYVQAAQDLKGEAILGAIDVAKPGNSKIRQLYNITGFPTLLYYEKGKLRFPYNGENKRQSIVDFVRDPLSQLQMKREVEHGTWPESDVVHLTADNFDSVLAKAQHALVVFYAPWCGHCKKIKPEYEKAAARVKTEKINGILAAVDATKEQSLASRFGVNGYPTLKYFKNGEYQFKVDRVREEREIIEFIKNPKEPPPPPPPETPWEEEEESAVRHLTGDTFKNSLRKIKHAIVMFYAPWCGHCKNAKPQFIKAAEKFADELLVLFGAVDCTNHKELCANYDVKGYPTFKYFTYFDKVIQKYEGGRTEKDFVSFIHTRMGTLETGKKPLSNQEAGFGVNVRLSSDDDFETLVASPTPTFVMFYASWCGHCIEFKPVFSKLATTLKGEGSPVNVVAIDAAENPKTADSAGIEQLPTFKIYSNGKILQDYEGERSYDEMLSFCKKHQNIKTEL